MAVFENRVDAGRQLAGGLERFRGTDAVVLGIPRGGVPVAYEVAHVLDLPLGVIIVRKLGMPRHPELAMGAIAEGGAFVLDEDVLAHSPVSAPDLRAVETAERSELERRVAQLRHGAAPPSLAGRTAIIVDDGLATGSTARAACQVVRRRDAALVVLAVPVGPIDELQNFTEADEVVWVSTPRNFWAVGSHYRNFSQTTDEEVMRLLGITDG